MRALNDAPESNLRAPGSVDAAARVDRWPVSHVARNGIQRFQEGSREATVRRPCDQGVAIHPGTRYQHPAVRISLLAVGWIERTPRDIDSRDNRLIEEPDPSRISAMRRNLHGAAGRRRRLADVASTEANAPTRISAALKPERMNQNAKRAAARGSAPRRRWLFMARATSKRCSGLVRPLQSFWRRSFLVRYAQQVTLPPEAHDPSILRLIDAAKPRGWSRSPCRGDR
jgi:hypothetical protein